MPMKSKAQRRWMWANKPRMARRWEKETPKGKELPERVKEAMATLDAPFSKLAKELFDPMKSPPVPGRVVQQEMIQAAKEDKMRGMTPVEYRNELTSRRTGIISKNRDSAKSA